jgi:hypothetical protein
MLGCGGLGPEQASLILAKFGLPSQVWCRNDKDLKTKSRLPLFHPHGPLPFSQKSSI